MEQQITDQICLLFVSSPGDETAKVSAALAQHLAITILPCEDHESLANVLTQDTIDAVCLTTNDSGIHGSDTEAWIAQLKQLDGRLPIIMLAPPAMRAVTADLMDKTRVIVLSKDDVPQPYFPALLRRLIDCEQAQQIEADFDLKDATILSQALVSANTQLTPQKVLAATCQHIRQALNVSLVVAGLIEGDQLVIVGEDHEPDYPSAIDDVVDLPQTPFLQYALMTQRTLAFGDVQTDIPRLVDYLHRAKARGLLITPLVAHSKVIGMVSVENDTPRTFTRREIELVKLIVTAAAPALENAQLFQEVQTAHRRAEEALAHLQRLDALKTQFIQNVSHELRTPLAIVRGYIDLTLDSALGDEMEPVLKQAFQTIRTHIHHLNTLVEAITVLEEAETQHISPIPQPVQPVVRMALHAISPLAAEQQIKIITDLPDALPIATIDAHYLIRALSQVLDNAIKFNRKPGRVWVKAAVNEDEIWLRIEDEGIGISAVELPHIFERFYQIDGTTSRKYGGMGLGLAIVKEVIAAHQGRVWAESQGEGQGTALTIALPIHKPEV
ncbi:MAG: sensor histidine kinase [Anaerolineae bacterium]|jgi:signal transduction histidine kinase